MGRNDAIKEGDIKGRRVGGREGHVLKPPRPQLDLHQKVVRIHDRVYRVVHGDEIYAGVAGRVGEPGVEEDGHVVVPVTKGGKDGGKRGVSTICRMPFPPALPPTLLLTNAETWDPSPSKPTSSCPPTQTPWRP